MKNKRMVLFTVVFCSSLFLSHFFALPADAQSVMSSMNSYGVQDSSVDESSDVDCGDGTYCRDGQVCVADDKCCPDDFPYYCGNQLCSVSPSACPECPAEKILGKGNPQLESLRIFRDSRLARSFIGSKIIEAYYNNAARINAALDRSPAFRIVATRVLEKIVPMLGTQE